MYLILLNNVIKMPVDKSWLDSTAMLASPVEMRFRLNANMHHDPQH